MCILITLALWPLLPVALPSATPWPGLTAELGEAIVVFEGYEVDPEIDGVAGAT